MSTKVHFGAIPCYAKHFWCYAKHYFCYAKQFFTTRSKF